jgi:hypothetical protein
MGREKEKEKEKEERGKIKRKNPGAAVSLRAAFGGGFTGWKPRSRDQS